MGLVSEWERGDCACIRCKQEQGELKAWIGQLW
jgi:hypothetical protein